MCSDNKAAKSGGRLIYLIGASGAGKDFLLRRVADQLQASDPVRIARRWITRPASGDDETHHAVSRDEFISRAQAGQFALWWQAHDLYYGIDREIEQWLANGQSVIVNGSRAYLHEAQQRFPVALMPLMLHVPENQLAERLAQRGRESRQAIQQRIERHRTLLHRLPEDVITVDNGNEPETAVQAILDILRQESDQCV